MPASEVWTTKGRSAERLGRAFRERQLRAFLLRRVQEAKRDGRPALLVAPTSVVGDWVRELRRFAPSLHLTQRSIPRRAKTGVKTSSGR